MARRRFFVSEVRGGEAAIEGDEAQHLTRVLRVEPGQRYEISDNRTVWLAEITSARKSLVMFRTIEKVPLHPPPVRMYLYSALIKFDHFEWIVEKATELGVERIVPVRAMRTERGLEQAAGKRGERWRRIAVEASQQCRRDTLPEIGELAAFEEAIGAGTEYRYACDENPGAPPPLLQAVPAVRRADDEVSILIGPEGGWTDEERERFIEAGWTAVSLGTQILRAETAAIAALAIASAAWQVTPIQ